MKRLGLLCCVCLYSLVVHGDTNKTQSLSLEEAVQMALEHNLSIQIDRYNPMLDKFALEADYGVAYEPYFNAQGSDSFNSAPTPNAGLTMFEPNESDSKHYSMGIGGNNGGLIGTPWGMEYGLTTSYDRSWFHDFSTTNGLPYSQSTQNATFAGLTLQQPLLKGFWIDTNRAAILTVKKTIQYDELGFRLAVMTNINQTEDAYYELIYSFDNLEVQKQAVQLAAQLVDENKKRVQAGTLTVLDVAQSQSQLATAQAALLSAQKGVMTNENILKSLITDQYRQIFDTQLTPSDKLLSIPEMFDVQMSWQTALAKRPDILQAKVNIDRLDINRRFQRNQLFPELDLTGSYGRTGLTGLPGTDYDIPANRYTTYSYGVLFSVPLSNKAARNNYKSAKALIKQAELAYRATEQSLLINVENTIESARSDFEEIRADREAREYAEQALNAEQKKLAVGTSTLFIVLQLQNNLTATRSAEIRSLANYNEALAQLAFYEGTILEKHHLTVKVE